MQHDLKAKYKEITNDVFPSKMEISFYDELDKKSTLFYEKVSWTIDGEKKGLRYGENPEQSAALFKLINGNLQLSKAETIYDGKYLVSDAVLLQSGKHPGKTNLTDIDSALNILRYFSDSPMCAIIKHNNPSGIAKATSISEAYEKAYLADRVAAFGGAVVLNRALDIETAVSISESYSEVVAAPEFESGVLEIFEKKKNIRVVRIPNIEILSNWVGRTYLDFKTLVDGGIIAQTQFNPVTLKKSDFLNAECENKGSKYKVNREPTEKELDDMLFGWLVETGITSNSVIYVKDGVSVGIGTGEQDRVGVAEIAKDKAYRKLEDRYAFLDYKMPFSQVKDTDIKKSIQKRVQNEHGGLIGSVMISDAFFPFRDGIDVGLQEGVSAVVQPGGSLRDFEVIEACNEAGATMKFTGQRCFRH